MKDGSVKVYLEMDPDRVAVVDEIVNVCRLDSRAAVFGVAVDLLHEAVKAVLDGKEIHFVGPDSSERIRLPALDRARPLFQALPRPDVRVVHDRPLRIVRSDEERRPNLRIVGPDGNDQDPKQELD